MRDPRYEQVAARIRAEWVERPDVTRLPDERELARRYGVGIGTVRRALRLLADAGFVERTPGRGTFVRRREPEATPDVPADDRRRGTVAVVVPRTEDFFMGRLLGGILRGLHKLGMDGLVGLTEDEQDVERAVIKRLRAKAVDGFIIFPVNGDVYNVEVLRLVVDAVPTVFVDRWLPGVDVPCVRADHREGARRAVQYLREHGRRRIALVSVAARAPYSTPSIEERLAGYQEAIRSERSEDRVLLRGDLVGQFGRQVDAVAKWLKATKPDAALAVTMADTRVLVEATRRLGLRIPDDFGLIGFDYDLEVGLNRLPWVDQHEDQTGVLAAQVMAGLLGQGPLPPLTPLVPDVVTAPTEDRLPAVRHD